MKQLTFILTLFFLGNFVTAQSVTGTWKTIDDNTGKARSYIKVYEQDGKLYGKIVKILDPAKQDKICTKCKGSKKNKKVLGLVILEGLEKDGSKWDDGKITDPDNGKEYSCNVQLDGADKLKVRGYIGFSLIGRTQVWERVE